MFFIGGSRINATYDVEVAQVSIPTDEEAVERGRHLVWSVGLCTECHGESLAGDVMSDDALFGRLAASNLTSGKGGIAQDYTDEDWVRAIRNGIRPNGEPLVIMPAEFFVGLGEEDLGAIIAYLKTLPPVDNETPERSVGPLGRIFAVLDKTLLPARSIDHDSPILPVPEEAVSAEYGRYLGFACSACHGEDLKGGSGDFAGPNITRSGATRDWTEAGFIDTFRTGVTPDGNALDQELMPWRNFGWAVVAIPIFGLSIASVGSHYDQQLEFAANNARSLRDLSLSSDAYALYVVGLGIAVVVVHLILAAVISWRRADDWVAWLISIAMVANGAITPVSPLHSLAATRPAFEIPVNLLIYFGLVSGVIILYLFPNGRFIPRWTAILAVAWAVINIPAVFLSDSAISFIGWPIVIQFFILAGWAATGIYAQAFRYAYVSSPTQRQQTKWAALGLGAAAIGPLAFYFSVFVLPTLGDAAAPNIFYQRIGSTFFTVSVLFRLIGMTGVAVALLVFPLSFAFAILRYRLWDIDLLINRTLVYAALTGSIAVIYFAIILVLQMVFQAVSNQGTNLALVVSTLTIAAMFQPLRRQVQNLIDRRFYRRKYDAARTLASFTRTCRNEVDINRLSQTLVGVTTESVQPRFVSLWLKTPEVRE